MLNKKIDNLRAYRVGIRRQMRAAQRMADPISRQHALDQLNLALKLSDDEWQALNARAGRNVGGKPVRI